MKRRDFIGLLGSATAMVATPPVARSQQTPTVGFLGSASPGPWARFVAAFRAGLKEMGYAEGQNLAIEFRWAEGHYDRLPKLAAELVDRNVTVLIATGGVPSVVSAKSATATIPIVFTLGTDPVRLGLVASLNRPGGNVTGVYLFTGSIDAKRLGILHDLLPGALLIAVLLNPKNPNVAERLKIIEDAARIIGRPLHVVHASTVQDLDTAFAALAQVRAQALFVGADPFFNAQRIGIVSRVADLAIPAIYEGREFAVAGGLMSYGTSFFDNYRQAGLYAGRILKGEKAAELPVVQSTKFELVLNLKTAKALGLQVPPGLSAQADEIIE